MPFDGEGARGQRHRRVGQGQPRRRGDGVGLGGLDEGPERLQVHHGIGQSRLDEGLGGTAKGLGDGGADAEQDLGLDGHTYQHVPGAETDGALEHLRLEREVGGRRAPEVEDPFPGDEDVVEHDDGVHLVPGGTDRMVRRIRRRQRLATDDVDAPGIHGRREVHALLGREVGPRRRHAEELVGIRRLRSHALGPAHDDAVGSPRHDPQGFLLGRGVVPVMEGIVEDGRDAPVVLAAGLEEVADVLGEARVLLAQEIAHVVEPDRDRGQVLGQAAGDAARPSHEALVHPPLPAEIVHRAGRQVREAHSLARRGRRHREEFLVRRVVLEVVDLGYAAGAAGQRGMARDVIHPPAHQPHAAPVP